MTSVVVQRLMPGRDSADYCGGAAVAWGPCGDSAGAVLASSISWTSFVVLRQGGRCPCCAVQWVSAGPLRRRLSRPRDHARRALSSTPGGLTPHTRLGVQIVPASCSSSELSSHQMAIRSHPGLQKMPANGISSELSAHQMAPAGAIAHSRAHLCPRASSFSCSSFVSPLRPLGLGLLARGDPRSLIVLRRYGRRPGQPSSSSLARRACVHVLPFSAPGFAVYGYKFSSSSAAGTP